MYRVRNVPRRIWGCGRLRRLVELEGGVELET